MSFKTLAIDYMVDNGMFLEDAKKVFEEMKKDESNEAMKDRWDDAQSRYPEPMAKVAIMVTNLAVVKWIDENCPEAWFRPMFTGERRR